MTVLRDFKAKYLAKLLKIRGQLLEKYPDKGERVNYVVDVLAIKLHNLRSFTLTDYISTIYHASKEFRELEQLIPSEEEIDELLKKQQ
jgi:hypothetical protein